MIRTQSFMLIYYYGAGCHSRSYGNLKMDQSYFRKLPVYSEVSLYFNNHSRRQESRYHKRGIGIGEFREARDYF